MSSRNTLADFLARHSQVVRVRILRVRGSSPREAGTEMWVAADAIHGTIGGGQLEYMALDEARALLGSARDSGHMDVPLGPEIGQCCGGRVEIGLRRVDAALRERACAAEEAERAAWPEVQIHGAGHVGRALACCLERLPVRTMLVDSRPAELHRCTARVTLRLAALAEAEIRNARPGTAFVVLTHDHALDFLLTAEALGRGDAAYVGLIGSATKRASFESWCRRAGGISTARLICPIGAGGSRDKRPEVIAAFVAAETMQHLAVRQTLSSAAQQERARNDRQYRLA